MAEGRIRVTEGNREMKRPRPPSGGCGVETADYGASLGGNCTPDDDAIDHGAAGYVEELARIVTPIRRRWPHVRILVRAGRGGVLLSSWVQLIANTQPRGSVGR
jgi:hypothetical protein